MGWRTGDGSIVIGQQRQIYVHGGNTLLRFPYNLVGSQIKHVELEVKAREIVARPEVGHEVYIAVGRVVARAVLLHEKETLGLGR